LLYEVARVVKFAPAERRTSTTPSLCASATPQGTSTSPRTWSAWTSDFSSNQAWSQARFRRPRRLRWRSLVPDVRSVEAAV